MDEESSSVGESHATDDARTSLSMDADSDGRAEDSAGMSWQGAGSGPSSPLVLQVTENAMALSTGGGYMEDGQFQPAIFPFGVSAIPSGEDEDEEEDDSDGLDRHALRSASSGSVLLCDPVASSRLGHGGSSWDMDLDNVGLDESGVKNDLADWILSGDREQSDDDDDSEESRRSEEEEEVGPVRSTRSSGRRPRRAAAVTARSRLGSRQANAKKNARKTKKQEEEEEEVKESEEEEGDSDEESDSSESDDPSTLWCICGKPHSNRCVCGLGVCSSVVAWLVRWSY